MQINKMGLLTWDVLTLGRFDSGTFWLWDVLTWDVLILGRFDLGRFDSGTFWLGTFWLWDVLTWDDLNLGHFDQCVHKKIFAISSLIKYSENILGTFWLTKNGTFWQITWDVLVLGRFDRIPLTTMLATSTNVLFPAHDNLLTTGTDDPSLTGTCAIIKASGHRYWWLAGGYDLEMGLFRGG